jgi:hypothetical protein
MVDLATKSKPFDPNYEKRPRHDGIQENHDANWAATVQYGQEQTSLWDMQPGYPNFESDLHQEISGEVIETDSVLSSVIVEQLTIQERGGDEWRVVNAWKEVYALLKYDSAPESLKGQLTREDAYDLNGKPFFILGGCKVGDHDFVSKLPFKLIGGTAEMSLRTAYFALTRYAVKDCLELTRKLRRYQTDTPEKFRQRLTELERRMAIGGSYR